MIFTTKQAFLYTYLQRPFTRLEHPRLRRRGRPRSRPLEGRVRPLERPQQSVEVTRLAGPLGHRVELEGRALGSGQGHCARRGTVDVDCMNGGQENMFGEGFVAWLGQSKKYV